MHIQDAMHSPFEHQQCLVLRTFTTVYSACIYVGHDLPCGLACLVAWWPSNDDPLAHLQVTGTALPTQQGCIGAPIRQHVEVAMLTEPGHIQAITQLESNSIPPLVLALANY